MLKSQLHRFTGDGCVLPHYFVIYNIYDINFNIFDVPIIKNQLFINHV